MRAELSRSGLDRRLGIAPALRSRPTLAGYIDDDAVRILELALEVLLLGIVPEIHEERAACRLHLLLSFGDIIDDEAEVVGADKILHVGPPRALVAAEVQEREVHHTVGQIDRRTPPEIFEAGALESERFLVELGRLFLIANDDCKMPQLRHRCFPFVTIQARKQAVLLALQLVYCRYFCAAASKTS